MGLLKNIGKSVKKLLGIDEEEEEKTAKKSQSSSASGRKVTVGKTIVTLPTENQKKSSSQKSTSTAKKSVAKSSGADSGRKVTVGKTITTLPTASTKKQRKKTADQDEGRKITVGKTIVTLPKAGEDRETAFDRVMERAGNTVASGLAGTAAAGTDAARTLLNAMAQSRRRAENIRTPIGITKGNVYANRGYDPFNAARSRRETENLERASVAMNRAAEQMLAREAEAYEAAKAGLGPVGTAAVDIGKAGTELALDAAANLIVPGAGLASMGVRSFGRGVRQAEDEGKSGARAVLYGAGNAAIELGTEKISAAAKPLKAIYGSGALDDVVERLTRKLLGDSRGRQALALIGRSAGGEAAEEAIASVIQVPLQNLTLQNGAQFDAEWAADTAYQALIGGILGGVLGGAGVAVDAAAGRGRNSTAQPRRLEAQLPTYAQAQAERNAVDMERAAVQNEEKGGGALNGEQGQVSAGTGFAGRIQRAVQERGETVSGRTYGGIQSDASPVRFQNTGAAGRRAGEFGIQVETVPDFALRDRGIKDGTGYSRDGIIYLNENLSDEDALEVVNHELVHTMKQADFEPYLQFTQTVEGRLQQNEDTETVFSSLMNHRGFHGDYDGLDLNQKFTVLDELNATLYGGYQRYPEFAIENMYNIMPDPEGYLAELDGILAQYRKSRSIEGVADSVLPAGEAGGTAAEPMQKGKLEARLPTYEQAQEMQTVRKLAEKLGTRVQIDDTIAAPSTGAGANGYYQNGVIHIARDAENSTMEVLKHELTHRIQDAAPQEYAVFREFAMQQSGADVLRDTMRRYETAGITLTEQEAMDEIAADYAQKLLTDQRAVEDLIREDPTLAERFLDAIRRMIHALTGTTEEKTLRKAEKMWTDAYRAARRNVSEKGNDAQTDGESRLSIRYDRSNTPYVETEILENKTSTDYITKSRNGTGDRQSAPVSGGSISETGGDVNGRYSLKERDREYLSAVESGNTQEAQRLVDEAAEAAMPESKIRGQDGRLTPVYHGTRDMFWRFDTAVKGGVNGTAEGFGIYTSDDPAVTSAYGDRQLKMFANITHPATSTEKTITPKTLAALIKDTCEREARQQVADGEYDSVQEALRDTWVYNYTDTYSAPMPQVYREAAQSILDMNDSDMAVIQEVMTGMGIRDYADATSFYENSLIPVTGIDGFVTQWESGDTGERPNIILALNSSQLKSADAVTRDDSGNVIPLSERFDPSEGDIRYSVKKEKNAPKQTLKDLRAERKDVLDQIDRLEWLRERNSGLNAADTAELERLNAREKDLNTQIEAARAEQKRTEKKLPEAQRIREKTEREAAAAQPKEARKTLRQDLLDTFHIQAGRRKELGRKIDAIGEQVLERGYATASDEADLYRALYNAGVVVDTTASEAYAGVRSELNGARIYVDEETRADLGDDWDAVRKSAFANRIILTTKEDAGGQGIDQLHADLAERYPGLFDYTATDGAEMLDEMIRAAELGKPKHISLMESAMQEGGEDAVAQQMAFFDKYLTDALNNFAKQAGFEMRIRGDAIRKFGKEKELFAAAQTRASEQRALREAHNRTLNAFKRLRRMRKKEGPEVQKAIDDLIGGFDTFAKNMRQDTEANFRNLREIYDQKRREDPNFLPDKNLEARFERLSALKVGELTKDEAMELYRAGTQLIHDIQTAHREIAEKNARDMADLYSRSASEINSSDGAKKTTSRLKTAGRELWNEDQLSPMNYIEKLGGWRRDGAFYSMAQQLEQGEYEKQRYIIESDKLLEGFLEKNSDWLAKADGRGKDSIWYKVEVPEIYVAGRGGTDLRKMGKETTYMTPMMKAKLYLDTRNDDNLRHIKYGGIKFPDKDLYQKGDITGAYARGKTVRMEPEFVKSLVDNMTEQEKELAHIIGDLYFNDYAKKGINKTSMLLEGFEKATSSYYSPIYTDHNYLASADPAIVDATLEGGGMLKSRVWSGTPTLAVSLLDAYQKHQDFTAKYVGLAIPIRNMRTLLNYTEQGYNNSMKNIIAQKWGESAGKYLDDLLVNLQNKPQEKTSKVDALINKGISGYVKAVFGMNPGTVLKQPPGYFMAGARLGFDTMPKTALIRPATRKNRELIAKYTPVLEWRARGNSSRELAELRKNPGWTDKNAAARFLFGGAIQWMDLHTVAAMWPWAENYVKKNFPDLKPGSQKQINDGTDPYYKKVAEVFNDAVANSQPMYDDMHTAQIMHSKSGYTRIFTMFKSAQMTQANALRQAWGEMRRKEADFRAGRKDVTEEDVQASKKAVANGVAALMFATLGFEAIGMLINVLKRNNQMKDEDGEYTMESVGTYLLDAMGRDLAGNVIGGDFLWDIGTAGIGLFGNNKWYGMESIGIDMIEDIANDAISLRSELGKFVGGASGMDSAGDVLYYMKTEGGGLKKSLHDTAVDVSYLFGIPLNNAESYLLAALSWINPDAAVAYKSKYQDYDKKAVTALSGKPREQKAAIRQMVRKSMPGIEKDDLDELVRVYMEATDKTSLLPGGSPDSVSVDGEEIKLKSQQKVDYNRAYTGVLESGMHTLLGSEEYADMTDQEKAAAVGLLYQYADESAKQAAIEGYEMDGWAESAQEAIAAGADPGHTMTFRAATKDMEADKDASGKAIDGSKARKQTAWLQDSGWSEAEQAALWYAFVPTDSTREGRDALRKEGIDRTTLYQYETAAAAVEPDKDAAGKTVAGSKNKKLFAEVDALDLDEDRKAALYMARVDDVSEDKYYQQAMDAGIGAWDYVRFKANTGAMASDKDSAGKSISGSKKRKVLAFIDSLDLDSAQKDVLYYAAGYTQSTIGDSPWRGGTVSTGSSGGRSGSSRKTSGGKSSASASRPAGGGEKTQRYLARAGETREQTMLPTPGTAPTGENGGAVQRYLRRGGSGGNVQAYLKRYGE